MRLSVRLLALVLIVALPVFATQVYDEFSQREQRKVDIAGQVRQAAALIAAKQDRLIEGARQMLTIAARMPAIRSHDGRACGEEARLFEASYPDVAAAGAATPDGHLFCFGGSTRIRAIVEQFDFARVAAAGDVVVGARPGNGQLEPATLLIAYPALDADGGVAAVVFVVLDLQSTLPEPAATGMPQGAVISLLDRDGRIVAQTPEAAPGGDGTMADTAAKALEQPAGPLVTRGDDGVDRFFGFAALSEPAGLIVAVGLPQDALFADAHRRFWQQILFLAGAFLVAGIAALLGGEFWIRRPILALRRSADRMAHGDLAARTAPIKGIIPELSGLASSFNAMAHSLQTQETELRESDERLRAALSASATGTFRWDLRADHLHCHDSLRRLMGLGAQREVVDMDGLLALIDPRDRANAAAALARSAQAGTDLEIEFRVAVAPDEQRWLVAKAKTFRGPAGEPLTMTGACADITARKRAEESQQLLMAELDHRVRNTLARVQSLIAQTRQSSGSYEEFAQAFEGRVRAMARAHGLLLRGRWEAVDLRDLVLAELAAYDTPGTRRVGLGGPVLSIQPRAALSLSLALHELATNAAKYGAFSVSAGRVEVAWALAERKGCRMLVLRWVEVGGPRVAPPTRRGFGRTLIERSLTYELDGEVELAFPPTGVRCAIALPQEHLARARSAPRARALPAAPAGAARAVSLGGKRILVVEDEYLVASSIRAILAASGCELVGPAQRLEKAVRLAREAAIDGAILDVDLDGEAVYPVADELMRRGIPFLFTTGYDSRAVLPQTYRAMPAVRKPFAADDLVRHVSVLLSAA